MFNIAFYILNHFDSVQFEGTLALDILYECYYYVHYKGVIWERIRPGLNICLLETITEE